MADIVFQTHAKSTAGTAAQLSPGVRARCWTPDSIHQDLAMTIKGQQRALELMATRIYEHVNGFSRPNTCVLAVGPSGCGKTLCVNEAARLVKVPSIVVNASAMVAAGIHGTTVADPFERLLDQAIGDGRTMDDIERAVICFDEFDKLLGSVDDKSLYGATVINQLLAIIGGSPVDLIWSHSPANREASKIRRLPTRRMLFVLAGAWTEKHAELQAGAPGAHLGIDQLGLPHEMAGRISAIIPFNRLTPDDLLAILEDLSRGPWSHFLRFLASHQQTVEMRRDVNVAIAVYAAGCQRGTRGCNQVIDALTSHIRYRIPSMPRGYCHRINHLMVDQAIRSVQGVAA